MPEKAYVAVTTPGADSGFFEQGLYKLGWSMFKQSLGEESVAAFMRLLDRDAGARWPVCVLGIRLSRPERELTADALRAMAISFSDLDGPATLDATLAQRGDPPYAHLVYEALGDFYLEKERYLDAAVAFEAFAKRRPDDRYAPSLTDAHHRGLSEEVAWLRWSSKASRHSSSVTRSARLSGVSARLPMRPK